MTTRSRDKAQAGKPAPFPLTRRSLFFGGAVLVATSLPARALTRLADLRNTIAAAHTVPLAERISGPETKRTGDQTEVLHQALERSIADGKPLFLDGGTYSLANLDIPSGAVLVGVPGRTRLLFRGDGTLITAQDKDTIRFDGITFDGGNLPIDESFFGLLSLAGIRNLSFVNCTIENSSRSGLALDRCSGSVRSCTVRQVRDAGLRLAENSAFSVTDTTISDCGNLGIFVVRWTAGEDGSLISGNRVERIAAKDGGTGQNGNGINVFQAHGVTVSNNKIRDCAFSAIRANTASNAQILGNSCEQSGETAIYSEFGFQGAVISNNVVDGAANGISIANFDQGGRLAVCSGNVVRNINGNVPYPHEENTIETGFGIAAEADTSITGNVVEDVSGAGLQLGWGPYMRNLVASQNVLRQCRTGIAISVVEGAGNALISGNILSDCKDGAILGYRWQERATDELVTSGLGKEQSADRIRVFNNIAQTDAG